MEFRQLQIFCAAAQLLNFTRAGQTLGYAQSNVTAQIGQLEKELKVKLFERMGRSVQLTADGKTFFKSAQNILTLCESSKAEFLHSGMRGSISLGAAETVCIYRLPEILTEYRSLYPQVELRVQTESCEHFYDFIKNGTVDLALVLTDKVRSPEMKSLTLHQEPMTIVAGPVHPLAKSADLSPGDFAGACLILTLPGCGYRPLVLAALEKHRIHPGSLMELSSVGAIKQCVACGLGIAILPRIAVQEDLDRGKLVELRWSKLKLNVKTQLIHHRDKWLSPAMNAFLELCRTKSST